MKISLLTIVLFFNYLLLNFSISAQGIGINAVGTAPNSSALLDLKSADKAFLITRVDTINIASPAFGLMTLAPIDSCLYMFSGVNWISLGGVGSSCPCSCSEPPIPPAFPCGGNTIPVIDVTGPLTGKKWMDRNLNASMLPTNTASTIGFGDLYQWGRCSDGHQARLNHGSTTILSTTDTPDHGDFIIGSPTSPVDWRSPSNNNLWQGVAGINNPCPAGYRVPTFAELDAERVSWYPNNAAGAYASPLKMTSGGARLNNGSFVSIGQVGYYWSSTINGVDVKYISISQNSTNTGNHRRASAFSVRCIKD